MENVLCYSKYCIYHRRKRHLEDIEDSYKNINDVIMCIDIFLIFPLFSLT